METPSLCSCSLLAIGTAAVSCHMMNHTSISAVYGCILVAVSLYSYLVRTTYINLVPRVLFLLRDKRHCTCFIVLSCRVMLFSNELVRMSIYHNEFRRRVLLYFL